jgi:RHS repeat-associated protein
MFMKKCAALLSPKILLRLSVVLAFSLALVSLAHAGEPTDPTDDVRRNILNPRLGEVDDLGGGFSYSYPIAVPPGRNGLQPALSLNYSSQPAEEGGVFGYGWSASIPYIQRLNVKGINNLYSQEYFYSSLSGELTSSTATTYYPRVDNGEFLSYTFSTSTWIVKDKKGMAYTFGSTTAAREDNPAATSTIYKWMLQEVRDTNNNFIKYEYWKDSGQIYPYKITYTGNASSDGVFVIQFGTSTRNDTPISYKPKFAVTTNYRVSDIQTKVSGSWVRKYTLGYTTGHNGNRSLLNTVTESGADTGVATTTLPAVTFDYQTTDVSTSSFPLDQAHPYPAELRYSIFADVNGDGLFDILRSTPNSSTTYLNDGNLGWVTSTAYKPPAVFFNDLGNEDQGIRAADVNGDGLTDLVQGRCDDPGSSVLNAWINNGNGWTASSTWAPPIGFSTYNCAPADTSSTYSAQFAEVNGDGLIDLIRAYPNGGGGFTTSVYLNTGAGWQLDNSYVSPSSLRNGGIVADLNNDGLADIMWASSGVRSAWLNTGSGWTTSTAYTPPQDFFGSGGNPLGDRGTRIGDINGDGLPDMSGAYLNTGTGWATSTGWPVGFVNPANSFDNGVRIGEMNGDGLLDFASTCCNSPFNTDLRYGDTSKVRRPDLLNRITFSQGGTKTITYKASGRYQDGSNKLLNPKLPYTIDTASKIETNDGRATTTSDSYGYESGSYYYSSPFDHRLSGFGKITRTDASGTITNVFYHQGDTSSSTLGEYNDRWSKIGKAYRTEVIDSASNTYAVSISKWDHAAVATTSSEFVKLIQKIDAAYDGNSTHRDKAESYTYNDTNGNLTQKIEWGEVTSTDDGVFTDTSTDKFTTNYSYASNTSSHILALPSDVTVLDQSTSTVRETKFYYDNLSLGNASTTGNLTRVGQWKSGSTWTTSTKVYDGKYGLVIRELDPLNATTTYTYESNNLYAATTTNALSQSTSYTYDYSSGKPKQIKDSNGRLFQTTYDGLDRTLQELQPDTVNPATTSLKTAYVYTDTAGAVSVQKTEYLTSSTSTDTYSYFDGLGRLIQTRKEAEASNTFAVSDRVYNSTGQLLKESLPYYAAGSASSTATTTSLLYTVYTYDAMGRVTRAVNAVGTSTNAYDDWSTTATDAGGNTKVYFKDAYDNLIRVDEIYASTTASTSVANAKIEISDGSVQALYHLENANDLSGNGYNLTNNNGIAFNPGKLTNAADSGANNTNKSLSLASALGNTGATTSIFFWVNVTTPPGTNQTVDLTSLSNALHHTYFYMTYRDTAGTKQLDFSRAKPGVGGGPDVLFSYTLTTGTWYHVGLTYDGNTLTAYVNGASQGTDTGSGDGVTEGDNFYLFTSRNNNTLFSGLMDEVVITNNVLSSSTISSLYNSGSGKEVCTTVGCGTTTQTTVYQNLSYTYDAVGNITHMADTASTSAKRIVDYTYDGLYRLTNASTTNSQTGATSSQTFSYNPIGDLTNKSDLGNYTYTTSTYANPHAPTTIGSSSLTYDNNGNLVAYGSTTYTWDYNNRIATSTTATSTIGYAYDYTGQRVKYTVGTSTTIYPSKYYEVKGASTTKYIFLPDGSLISIVNGTGTAATSSYVFTDHLGGTNVVTDATGTIVQTLDYMPYGSRRVNTGTNSSKRQFIGQRYDEEDALSYLNARYYNGGTGQFLSEDPVFWELGITQDGKAVLTNPQALNSYAYANGNPITNKDPEGRCVGPAVAICIGAGVGILGGIGSQAFNDYLTGDFGDRTFRENVQTYFVAAGQGLIVGAGTAAAALAAPFGVLGTLAVGASAGTLTVGTTYVGNYLLGKPTDPTSVIVGGGMSAVTAGTLKTLPQVLGRLPKFGTQAFYTGAHTARQAAEEFFSNSVQTFGQSVGRFVATQNYSTSQSGRGGSVSSPLIRQLQSLVNALQGLVSSLSTKK